MKHKSKVNSLLQLIPRKKFDALVEKWEMNKGVRDFKIWEQTCALILTHVLKLESYREIEGALGIARSTFSDANTKRSHGFFAELCKLILSEIRASTDSRQERRIIKNILAIDSSECSVHGGLFDTAPSWARERGSLGKKAALKLHTVWRVDDEWIEDFRVTPAKRCDNPIANQFALLSNHTYVFDRGYGNIGFWWKIMKKGSHFVTRLKCHQINEKALLKSIEKKKDGVLSDRFWRPSEGTLYLHPEVDKKLTLRHVIYRDAESKKIFHFVTSNFEISAEEIASIYKKRWSVELLYRWLKGHLNIRYFAVKNVNAVKTLLSVAVLVRLLVQLHKITIKFNGSAWECLRNLRTHLLRQSLSGLGFCPDCRWNALARAGSG